MDLKSIRLFEVNLSDHLKDKQLQLSQEICHCSQLMNSKWYERDKGNVPTIVSQLFLKNTTESLETVLSALNQKFLSQKQGQDFFLFAHDFLSPKLNQAFYKGAKCDTVDLMKEFGPSGSISIQRVILSSLEDLIGLIQLKKKLNEQGIRDYVQGYSYGNISCWDVKSWMPIWWSGATANSDFKEGYSDRSARKPYQFDLTMLGEEPVLQQQVSKKR